MKSKKWGDRHDGVWIKDMDSMHQMMAHLFKDRCEAEVYAKEEIDVTNLLKYIESYNEKDKEANLKVFHVFVMALARMLNDRPNLNRFICGRRYYQRNKISISFIVKRQLADNAEEMLMTLNVKDDTNLGKVSDKILGRTSRLREHGGQDDVDKVLDVFAKLPRLLQMFVMKMFRILDFFGKMPKSICDGDPNYSSVLISNLGSIKADAVYHHLNNYGTNSILITIGEIKKIHKIEENGNVLTRDVLNIGATIDERIGDGFYFAKSIKYLQFLINNPELLEKEIKESVEYVC